MSDKTTTDRRDDKVTFVTSRTILRDEFAKAALTGFLTSFEPGEDPVDYARSIAIDCYIIADAMLEARES